MKIFYRVPKLGWIAAIVSGFLFMFLLGTRLGFFQKETPSPPNLQKVAEKEIWMSISHQNKKIGYAHRRMIPLKDGYTLSDIAFLRINTMGLVQDIHILTTGDLRQDMSLASFAFELKSSLFNFKANGHVKDKILTVFFDGKPVEIPINDRLYLAASVLDAAWISSLEPNQTRSFSVFDPSTMGRRPVRVTLIGNETLSVMGQSQRTKKVAIDFMGTSQTAWIDEDGSVVQETGFMGLTLKKVAENEALSGLVASRDLTKIVSVAANEAIDEANKLKRLRLKITGIDTGRVFLHGGRQTLEDGVLTIFKENPQDSPEIFTKENTDYLKPTPFIQSDHPKIKEKVSEIVSPDDSLEIKAQKLVTWAYKNIEKRPVLSVPNALETLENRMGDCNEHAVLLAAMARAAGIPAQIEAGLVYMKGRFYYHAWNVLFLGHWITADALMGQMPADATHIRFVRGEPSTQIDLMGVIGKVKLEIMEQT